MKRRIVTAKVAAALASLTVQPKYTNVRCCECRAIAMRVPGTVVAEVRVYSKNPTGRGRTLTCPRCRKPLEIIEHVPEHAGRPD